jgi:hypothetical protein
MLKGMKQSNSEGLASHAGPEPCADVREDGGEASVGVSAGWVLSCEIHDPRRELRVLRGADVLEDDGRQDRACRYREARPDPARSETPCTHGINMRGNREIPSLTAAMVLAVRIVKPQGERR